MMTGKPGCWVMVLVLLGAASSGCGDGRAKAPKVDDAGKDGDRFDLGDGDGDDGPTFGDGDQGDGDGDGDGDSGFTDPPPAGDTGGFGDFFDQLFNTDAGMQDTMQAACDPDIPTTARCGGSTCQGSGSGLAGLVCLVPCCLPDDTCGTRRALLADPTDCVGPATPDPDCPALDNGFSNLEGCCAASGRCGVISGIDGSCITSSALLADLEPGPACGDSNSSTPDAGMGTEMDSGMDASVPDAGSDVDDASVASDTGTDDDEDAGE